MPNSKTAASFEIRPELSAIVQMWKNEEYIADFFSPRFPVFSELFEWWEFKKEEGYQVIDDEVGRTSKPNTVEFHGELRNDRVIDHALDSPVPNKDIENARNNPGLNPLGHAAEGVMDLVMLNREIRCATIAGTVSNYDSGNVVTLSGTDQFSDFTNSNPVDVIVPLLSGSQKRPNEAFSSRDVADYLTRHPKIINAIAGEVGLTNGIVSLDALARLFGLNAWRVGDAWRNTAEKGQTPAYSRVWGKFISFAHVMRSTPNMSNPQPTFCLTAQWGDRFGGTVPDAYMGARGGQMVRAGESVKEVVVSSGAGCLIADAVA